MIVNGKHREDIDVMAFSRAIACVSLMLVAILVVWLKVGDSVKDRRRTLEAQVDSSYRMQNVHSYDQYFGLPSELGASVGTMFPTFHFYGFGEDL